MRVAGKPEVIQLDGMCVKSPLNEALTISSYTISRRVRPKNDDAGSLEGAACLIASVFRLWCLLFPW